MNDNVRKIFDILGVEPNERFMIEGISPIYKIDEKLNVYNIDINCGVPYLQFLLNGEYKIIKLPKKKKLRDLTKEEYDKWCDDNKCYRCYGSNNSKCIFMNVPCNSRLGDCWIYNKDLYSDKFLDQEIEVK